METVQRRTFEIRPAKKPSSFNPLDPTVQELEAEEEAEHRRNLRIGIVVTVVFHVFLLVISIPERARPLRAAGPQRQAYVMKQVRFRPPEARPKQQAQRKPQSRRIPIPDPTPDDPEPLLIDMEEPEVPELDLEGIEGYAFIPEGGPPGPAQGAVPVSGDVSAPIKIYSPRPQYTEDARQARTQGVVILKTVVDTAGQVVDLKVLKGLPNGLTDSALETVAQWRFEPARQQGEPVAVYFLLTISFSLQ